MITFDTQLKETLLMIKCVLPFYKYFKASVGDVSVCSTLLLARILLFYCQVHRGQQVSQIFCLYWRENLYIWRE